MSLRDQGPLPSMTSATPMLDAATASQLLERVFAECGVEPNTVPMEALSSYTLYRRERFGLQRGVTMALMVLFFALPLLFVSPHPQVTALGEGERRLPVYQIEVPGVMPLGSVRAQLDTHTLPVYETGARSFTVEPTRNGELVVEVTLANLQRATTQMSVADVDAVAPELLGTRTDATSVYLEVADAGIGVNYQGAYGMTGDNQVVRPSRIDEATRTIVFDFPKEDLDVYVPDRIGNTVHLALTLG